MNNLYFDHAATTRCCEAASSALKRFSCEKYGNPSSTHQLGIEAGTALLTARTFFANHFKVKPKQIIFTGSGTEANNLALLGVCFANLAHSDSKSKSNVLISNIEHPAVMKTAESLSDFGFEVRKLEVDSNGVVSQEELQSKLDANTILVSVMRVNNIIGSINDIESLAKTAKSKNSNVVFHSDCVQAFGKISTPQADSAVDLISVSAHKIHGPKGVGALAILNPELSDPAKLRPIIWGGGQEAGMRSGTQNPGLILAFAEASKIAVQNQSEFIEHTRSLREYFVSELKPLEEASKISIFASSKACPHIVNLSIQSSDASRIADCLNAKGCMISTGSACSSNKKALDATLVAIGKSEEEIRSSIRISFDLENTEKDVQYLTSCLKKLIEEKN